METVCLKMDESMAKDMEAVMKKRRYATKTEFIRDAIRKNITEAQKQEMLDAINETFGASKRKTTDEDLHRAREKAAKEILKEFGLD